MREHIWIKIAIIFENVREFRGSYRNVTPGIRLLFVEGNIFLRLSVKFKISIS